MSEAARISLRERAEKEARDFLVVFVYVWFLLAILSLHRTLILSEAHIVQHQGLTFVKALAFAKIMFLAERWRFGEIFENKPLIWPVLFKSAAFAALLLVMDIAEEALVDRFWPKLAAHNTGDFAPNNAQMIISATIVAFAALMPFFALRELGRTLGDKPLRDLFFRKRMNFVPSPGETEEKPR